MVCPKILFLFDIIAWNQIILQTVWYFYVSDGLQYFA
jgi:hypothetical protein